MEVASILTLVFPTGQHEEYEFDVPLPSDELPQFLWKETHGHFAGIFRKHDGKVYHFERVSTREEATAAGIRCF